METWPPGESAPNVARTMKPERPRGPAAAVAIGIGIGLSIAGAVVGGFALRKRSLHAKPGSSAVVRIVTRSSTGTGFFVRGPDDGAYVATAYHVIANGEPFAIERTVKERDGDDGHVEAYPEGEVVAFDADADLAVLRIAGMRSSRLPTLELAEEVRKDDEIQAWGYPASSLARGPGIVGKPGKILSLVRFPAYDPRTLAPLRSDAVDGLLVSAEIEPGFSGGPTLDARGAVVGVNVTKDLAHRGQNGAVRVSALRSLLDSIPRATAPTPEAIARFLDRVQQELLLLPLEARKDAPDHEFVATSDLPRVRDLATELQRLEGDAHVDPKSLLSGRATVGLVLLRLPGAAFETWLSPSTKRMIADCEARAERLKDFFGDLAPDASAAAARPTCSASLLRPLIWDLAALAVRWEGKPRPVTVTKIESIDPTRHRHRASVRLEGIDHLIDVGISTEAGRLRLALFDAAGRPTAFASTVSTPARGLEGTWKRSEPRAPRQIAPGVQADAETTEILTVAQGEADAFVVTHQVRRTLHARSARLCGASALDLGLEQIFRGTLSAGAIYGARTDAPRALGRDMARCAAAFTYAPDRVAILKRDGDALVMVRTDGQGFPEAIRFER
jgi:S1-C subfamily serine protease